MSAAPGVLGSSTRLLLRGTYRAWPFGLLLACSAIAYGLPVLFGYPLWGDLLRRSTPILSLHNAADSTTFPLGTRPLRNWMWQTLLAGELPLWLGAQALGLPMIEQYEHHPPLRDFLGHLTGA